MTPTLLVAEGDGELRGIYQWFLTDRGYQVEIAADALECLAKVARSSPAVIVLDWELRWGGGDGVLAWLREEHASSPIPVVLTGTAGYSAIAGAALASPVNQVLPKPFALTTLLAAVRAALAGQFPGEPMAVRDASSHSEFFIG
jgi:DNA-binding response OmpR family regulator